MYSVNSIVAYKLKLTIMYIRQLGDFMIKLLIRKFIKDFENVSDKKVRESYTVFSGLLGLFCNFFLFLMKLFIGIAMNSIAVTGDAFNNLSDTCSGFVAIIGAKLSNKKPDAEHPFGHGRVEYISSLIISFLILLVGLKLFNSSIGKIKNPESIHFNLILVIILLISVIIKLWLFYYYKYIGNQINSGVLIANSKDSLNDVFSTSAVIIATVIGALITKVPVDGIMGLLVSIIIIYNGFVIAKETVGILLGSAPDKQTIRNIYNVLTDSKYIVGIHDLIVHDYGPGRVFASVHAEIPDNSDILKVHETIDSLEKRVKSELGINLVIHMDPVSVNNEKAIQLKEIVNSIVKEESSSFSIHDFRMIDDNDNIKVMFDLVVDTETSPEQEKEIICNIQSKIKEYDSRCSAEINLDNSYVEQQISSIIEETEDN